MRNRFHSLCPYFAMFPESFAQGWIAELTSKGDIVLDPFCGRGTTPFCAIEMGRRAIACDVNDVAICLTRAKTDAPTLAVVRRRISQLESSFDARQWRHEAEALPEFFAHAYSRGVLQRLVFLRNRLDWRKSRVDAMIAALGLGSLHGEADRSKSYFSNQMPRTISTKPKYSVRFWRERRLTAPERSVFKILRDRACFRYETPPPIGDCTVLHQDMRKLAGQKQILPGPIRCVVTSPPYFDTTNFEEDQWLRLWFLGGPSIPTIGRLSRDDRHGHKERYWRFISDMWRSLGSVVASNGHVVIRIGSRRIAPDSIAKALAGCSAASGRHVRLITSEQSVIRQRQTDTFHPGTIGCRVEVDCVFRFADK